MTTTLDTGTRATGQPRDRRTRPRLLVRRKQAARLCSVGLATWDRWTAAGLNPQPTKVAGAVLWSSTELAEWCRRGCPPRAEWSPIWQSVVARRTGRAR